MNVQDRLYIIVRSDLKPGLVVAQACHTAIEAHRKWNLSESHYLVVLDGGKSHEDMFDHVHDLSDSGYNYPPTDSDTYLIFREPDLNNEITGIAIQPDCQPKWIYSLPLLWKEVNNND